MNCLLFMMGGSGTRFGADIPKQYIEIHGIPLFAYTLQAYDQCDFVDKAIIVSNTDWMDYTQAKAEKVLANKLLAVTAGGPTRSHSVKNGLLCCQNYLSSDDILLIHDATNPFIDKDALKQAVLMAKESGIAALVTDQVHTLYRKSGDRIEQVIPRETVCSGYSPEVFRFSEINGFYEHADDQKLETMTSAVALALDQGKAVKCVSANICNLKITYSHDMEVFKAILDYQKDYPER